MSRTQRVKPDRSSKRCYNLRLKLLAKEEGCSSSSSLQTSWSARMATRWSIHRPTCSIRYRSSHVSSSANDSFKRFAGARSHHPHHSDFLHGRQNCRSSFCSGRGENLVTIARFGKPLFANMHYRAHAVARVPRKPKTLLATLRSLHCGWPMIWLTLSSHSADASVLTFRRPKGFFCICTNFFTKNVAIDWSALKTMAVQPTQGHS